jgi:hypothetical protein
LLIKAISCSGHNYRGWTLSEEPPALAIALVLARALRQPHRDPDRYRMIAFAK